MKRMLTIVLMATLTSTTLTACYGKFALTKKLYQANSEIKDKYARSLVTFGCMFIFPWTGLADWILFNTIEFWSGDNPIAEGEKDFQYAKGEDVYRVHATKTGEIIRYDVTRFRNGLVEDTSRITLDLLTGNTTTEVSEFGKTTRYVGFVENVDTYLQLGSLEGIIKPASL